MMVFWIELDMEYNHYKIIFNYQKPHSYMSLLPELLGFRWTSPCPALPHLTFLPLHQELSTPFSESTHATHNQYGVQTQEYIRHSKNNTCL